MGSSVGYEFLSALESLTLWFNTNLIVWNKNNFLGMRVEIRVFSNECYIEKLLSRNTWIGCKPYPKKQPSNGLGQFESMSRVYHKHVLIWAAQLTVLRKQRVDYFWLLTVVARQSCATDNVRNINDIDVEYGQWQSM